MAHLTAEAQLGVEAPVSTACPLKEGSSGRPAAVASAGWFEPCSTTATVFRCESVEFRGQAVEGEAEAEVRRATLLVRDGGAVGYGESADPALEGALTLARSQSSFIDAVVFVVLSEDALDQAVYAAEGSNMVRVVWLQEPLRNLGIEAQLREMGLVVVTGRCFKAELQRAIAEGGSCRQFQEDSGLPAGAGEVMFRAIHSFDSTGGEAPLESDSTFMKPAVQVPPLAIEQAQAVAVEDVAKEQALLVQHAQAPPVVSNRMAMVEETLVIDGIIVEPFQDDEEQATRLSEAAVGRSEDDEIDSEYGLSDRQIDEVTKNAEHAACDTTDGDLDAAVVDHVLHEGALEASVAEDSSEALLDSSREAVERTVRMIQDQSEACEKHAQIISQLERTQDDLETRLSSFAGQPAGAQAQDLANLLAKMEQQADFLAIRIEQAERRNAAAKAAARKLHKQNNTAGCGDGIRAMFRGQQSAQLPTAHVIPTRTAADVAAKGTAVDVADEAAASFPKENMKECLTKLEAIAADLEQRMEKDLLRLQQQQQEHTCENGRANDHSEEHNVPAMTSLMAQLAEERERREALEDSERQLKQQLEEEQRHREAAEAEHTALKQRWQEERVSAESAAAEERKRRATLEEETAALKMKLQEMEERSQQHLQDLEEARKRGKEEAEIRFEKKRQSLEEKVEALTRQRDLAKRRSTDLSSQLDIANDAAETLHEKVAALQSQTENEEAPPTFEQLQTFLSGVEQTERDPGNDILGPLLEEEPAEKVATKKKTLSTPKGRPSGSTTTPAKLRTAQARLSSAKAPPTTAASSSANAPPPTVPASGSPSASAGPAGGTPAATKPFKAKVVPPAVSGGDSATTRKSVQTPSRVRTPSLQPAPAASISTPPAPAPGKRSITPASKPRTAR